MTNKQIFNNKIDDIIASLTPLESAAVADTVTFLQAAHEKVLFELATTPPESWRAYHLNQVMGNIELAIDEYADKLGVSMARSQAAFWGKGMELTAAPLGSIGIAVNFGTINLTALETVQTYSTAFIRDLAHDTAGKIRRELSKVMIGQQTPFEAMKNIGHSLDNPSIFRSTLHRAENIVKNEINFAYSIAGDAALMEAAKWVDDLKKHWRYDHNPRFPRIGHQQIHEQVREVAEYYDVPNFTAAGILKGIEKLLYPRDRVNGSPGNTIGCGCNSAPTLGRFIDGKLKKAA